MSAGMAPRDGNGGEVEGPVVPPGRLEAQEPIDLTQVTTMPTSHATGGKGPREILPFDPDKKAKNITLKELALRTTRGLFPHGPDGASPEVRMEANKQLEALVREILPEEKIQGRVPRFLADGQARFFLPEDATKLDRQVRKRAEQIDEIRREFDAKPDWVQERIRDLMEPYKVFTLPQSIDIGRRTMNRLGGELANHNYQGFADGNSRVDLEDVSGYKCVLIAGQSGDPDAASMDIARYLSAMKNSGASEVILILTYYSSRLDRTDSGRTHIDLKLHAKEFERAGADFVIPIEPHCEHAELAFDRRYLPLRGSTIGLRAIQDVVPGDADIWGNMIIGSPDLGGMPRAHFYARQCGTRGLFGARKIREEDSHTEVQELVGRIAPGCFGLLVDDEFDTGGSGDEVAAMIKKEGAAKVGMLVTHPKFSKQAWTNIARSKHIDLLIVGNTIDPNLPLSYGSGETPRIVMFDMSPLISEVLLRHAISSDVRSPERKAGMGSIRNLAKEICDVPVSWVGHDAPRFHGNWWPRKNGDWNPK